jgi:hypothetical protein
MIHGWSSDPARIKAGIKVAENFVYTSENNSEWMSADELHSWIDANFNHVSKI